MASNTADVFQYESETQRSEII